ncbi:unnamed protein product [Allacma fusca]|nr:unnamed protein product [Allacma fusca]
MLQMTAVVNNSNQEGGSTLVVLKVHLCHSGKRTWKLEIDRSSPENNMDDSKTDFGAAADEDNPSDTDSEDSYFCDENEVDELLEEALPEDFRRTPKRRKLNPQDHDLIKNLGSSGGVGGEKDDKSAEVEAGELDEDKDDSSNKYNEKVVMILEEKGKSKFDDLPGGWIQVRHVSGMPLYLHRKTRICTLSKPYRLGPGSARRHSMPLSAIPCLSYSKALLREAAIHSKVVVENSQPSGSPPEVKDEPTQEPENSETLVTETDNSTVNMSPQSAVPTEAPEVPSTCPFANSCVTEVSSPPEHSLKSGTSFEVAVDDELEPGEIQDDDDTSMNELSMSGVNSSETVIKIEDDSQSVTSIERQTKNDDAKQSARIPSTPIHQRLKLFMDERPSNVNEPPCDVVKNMIPKAQVETSQEANELNSVSPEELREYCMRLFKFKQFTCKRFKSWRDRRKHTKEQKRLHLQRPTLPEGVQLITFPVQRPAGESDSGKAIKEYTMNPQGKSSVCILHEYVQHALRMQPSYTFGEIRNSSSPYAATVMINNVKYGIGYGTSKKLAKAAAAAATLEILIPEMKDVLKTSGAANNELYHIGYFDQVEMDDPRIPKMCASVSEPSPYALLLACLQRNFGQGSTSDIKFDVISTNGQANRFKMQTGEHCVEVTASNKREGKQLASQALLCKIHPHIKNFGSFLRLYGNGSIKSVKEKKQEEQQITTLQSKASANSPNYAILNKLKEEMLKLREKRQQCINIRGNELMEVAEPHYRQPQQILYRQVLLSSSEPPNVMSRSRSHSLPEQDFLEECLKSHNYYRRKHNVPDLELDEDLCKVAKSYAKKLSETGETVEFRGKRCGESIYFTTVGPVVTGKAACEAWYNEGRNYNWKSVGKQKGANHFTQLIWKGTQKLGMAMSTGQYGIYIVAEYSPPGNVDGKYPQN